jgi:hypothetical protein
MKLALRETNRAADALNKLYTNLGEARELMLKYTTYGIHEAVSKHAFNLSIR